MTPRPGSHWIVCAAVVVLAAPPARGDTHRALADFKAGRYLEAASELQAVVDRTPGYAWGYFLLGHCMLKMRNPVEAETDFRRALSLDASRPEYYQGLALATQALADWNRTIAIAGEGLGRAGDAQTRFALLAIRGYAYGAVQRWDAAVRDLEAAREIQAERRVLVLLGKAYFATGAFDRAIPPLREALSMDADDPEVLRLLAESSLRLAGAQPDPARKRMTYETSLEFARRLAALRPDDLDAIHLVGRAALGAGRLQEAESIFQLVLSRDGRQCYAMVNLGRTYMVGGRLAEAEAFLRKASMCAPRMAVVYETLGDLYMRRGRPQEAAAAFRRASEIDPSPRPSRSSGTPNTLSVSSPR
ncbi:MAG TPA: tetratricopeptide repeat protein [Candidatus Polarisedimenticolaceae bacterium]|nr:tetratricopeptide repeat protein [Candidatus Polarisedimenticolaceae bacterium]